MRLLTSILFIVACLLVSTSVFADVNKLTNTNKDSGGYGYEFDDDPLNAGGFGPNDSLIKVRPRAARATLIRPRTSFVPELLKSVEDI